MKPPKPGRRARAPDAQPEADVRVVREIAREPRLPHERDESADSQRKSAPDTLGRKALDDVNAGRVDTDRGPVLEELGRRLPSQGQPAPKRRRSR
jgi:hypothetical protein